MFGFKKRPKRPPNIAVYYLSAVVDGRAKSTPIGAMPRFSDDFEAAMRAKHQPKGRTVINDQIDDTVVILSCNVDGTIDAVCFLSEAEPRARPGVIPFRDNSLDPMLQHFPR
jgi:hypothetical protein